MKKRFKRKSLNDKINEKPKKDLFAQLQEALTWQAGVLWRAWEEGGDEAWVRMCRAFGAENNPTNIHAAVALTHWCNHGLQSVHLDEKLAAALMATSATGGVEKQRLPWPAFEIRVPPNLLPTPHGYVHVVYVCGAPEYLPLRHQDEYNENSVAFVYYDKTTTGHVSVKKFSLLAQYEQEEKNLTEYNRLFFENYDLKDEVRLRSMIARLVVGVVCLINTARSEKPDSFPELGKKPEQKNGARPVNKHQVARPVTIDCANQVRAYVSGTGGRNSPTFSTLVRGHWREQPYGPKWSLRKTIWVEPHFRGDGPLVNRPVKLKGNPE